MDNDFRFVLHETPLDSYLAKSGPHKYISKKMVRGKWVYEYKDDVVKRVVDLLLDFLSNPARTATLGQVARSFRVNNVMAKEVVDSLVAQKRIELVPGERGVPTYRQATPKEAKPEQEPVALDSLKLEWAKLGTKALRTMASSPKQKRILKEQKEIENKIDAIQGKGEGHYYPDSWVKEKPKPVVREPVISAGKVDPSLWHIESVGGGPKEYYLTDEGARKADSIGSGYTESKAALLRELASRGGKLAIERIVGSKVYLTPFGEDISGLDLLRLTGDGAIESVDPMPGYGRTYRLTDKGRDKIERMDGEQDDLLRRVRNTEKPEKVEPPKVLIEPPKKTKKELQAQKKELQREANKIHGAGGQLSLDFTVKLEMIDDKIVNADVDENAEKVVAELNKPETPKKKEPKKEAKPKNKKVEKPKSEDDERFTKEVGEHVWGSRADLAVDKVPLPLADLPTAIQAKQCVKTKLLPKVSNEELLDRGCTPECVLLRRAVEKCIAAKAGDTLKARQYYMNGIDFVARSLDACKTGQDVVDFLADWHYLGQGKTRRATYSKEDIFRMRYDHVKENIPQIAQYLKAEPEEMLALHTEGRKLDNEINELQFAQFIAGTGEQTQESLEREKLRHEKSKELSKINGRLFDMGATRLNGVPVNGVLAKKFGVSERDVDFDQKGHGDSKIVNVYVKDDSIEQSIKDNAYAQYTAGLGSNMIKLAGKRQREDYGPKAYKDAYRLTQEWKRKELTPEERETHMFSSLGSKATKRRPVFTWEKNVPGEIDRVGGMTIEGDVDVDRLQDTFNLQNIQHGKWMQNDVEAAKSHLSGAYGGFLDLAELVGIDPKTVGLNGRLSIGFGARGEGGFGAAKAHYEEGGKIINMTKFAGGGSLAHEWAHAIDHIMYVSRNPQDRSDHAFMSEGKTENVPQEVVEAHRAVMDAIKYADPELANIVRRGEKVRASRKFPRSEEETKIMKEYYRAKDSIKASEFFEDAITLSGPNGYYARNREMFARAFECYVEDTLTKKGRRSSYLVSGTKDKYESNRHTSEKNMDTGKDAQVYPHGDIRKRITDAIENLVKVLAKSKVLEKSLRLLDEQFFIKAG